MTVLLNTTPELLVASRPWPPRIWFVLVLLTAVILGGLGWWFYETRYKIVGHYITASSFFYCDNAGFLLQDSLTRFTFRDWRGQVRWKANISVPHFTATSTLDPWKHGCWRSASEDYRYFASVTADGDGVRIRQWRGSLLCADRVVPHFPVRDPRILPLKDGRVLLWSRRGDFTDQPLILFDGNREIARGTLPGHGIILDAGPCVIAPEGSLFAYYTMRLQAKEIHWVKRYTSTDWMTFKDEPEDGMEASCMSGGVVLADNGAIYTAAGRKSGSSTWNHEIPYGGTNYLLQSRGNRWRAYAPLTGDAWSFIPEGVCHGGLVADDGQFVSCIVWPKSQQQFYNKLTARFSKLSSLLENRYDRNFLAIYQRPGKLCAMQRLNLENWWTLSGKTDDNFWYNVAPDGRKMIVLMYNTTPQGKQQFQATVLRW